MPDVGVVVNAGSGYSVIICENTHDLGADFTVRTTSDANRSKMFIVSYSFSNHWSVSAGDNYDNNVGAYYVTEQNDGTWSFELNTEVLGGFQNQRVPSCWLAYLGWNEDNYTQEGTGANTYWVAVFSSMRSTSSNGSWITLHEN